MDPLTALPKIVVTTGTGVIKVVDNALKKVFSLEKNLKWCQMDKKYLSHFIENDITNRVIYSQKGYMNYVVSYVEYKITQIAF